MAERKYDHMVYIKPTGIVMAMGPKQKPIVKGRVQEAVALIYSQGTLYQRVELPLEDAPYHLNNMTEWFRLIIKHLDDKDFKLSWLEHKESMTYRVNDGKGEKSGSDGYQNKFTYEFGPFLVDLHITTKSHQKQYYEELKAGIREKKSTKDAFNPWEGHYTAKDGALVVVHNGTLTRCKDINEVEEKFPDLFVFPESFRRQEY